MAEKTFNQIMDDMTVNPLAEMMQKGQEHLAEGLETASEPLRAELSARLHSAFLSTGEVANEATNKAEIAIESIDQKSPETTPVINQSIATESSAILASRVDGTGAKNTIENSAPDTRDNSALNKIDTLRANGFGNHADAHALVSALLGERMQHLPLEKQQEIQAQIDNFALRSAEKTPDNQVQQVALLERQQVEQRQLGPTYG